MAEKPVKFLSDVVFKRNVVKEDRLNNKLFEVSGTLANGVVNIAVPLSASDTYIAGDLNVSGSVSAKKFNVTEVNTNVIYETSISASINALLDVSASDAQSGDYLKYESGYWIPSALDLEGGLGAVRDATNRLKYINSGSFNSDGIAEVYLPLEQIGGNAFPTGSIDYIMYDVSIKDGSLWLKHIVNSYILVKNNQLCITIEAPALSNTDEYKLLAINTNPEDYII